MTPRRTALPSDLVQIRPGLGVLRLAALLADGEPDDESLDAMFQQMESGAFDALSPSEIWPELARGLMTRAPATISGRCATAARWPSCCRSTDMIDTVINRIMAMSDDEILNELRSQVLDPKQIAADAHGSGQRFSMMSARLPGRRGIAAILKRMARLLNCRA